MNIHEKSRRACVVCRKETIHSRDVPKTPACAGQAFLTICTCGLWLPFAILIVLLSQVISVPWTCEVCGYKTR